MSEASFEKSILRAWRKAGYAYRWWQRLHGEEHPNSAKAAATFEDAMAAAMKADPMMDGVARAETTQFPRIVCLCGSTRFKDAYHMAARNIARGEGDIVLTVVDLDPNPENRDVNILIDDEVKARLDELHLRQIDLADEILVLNVGGYIGQSTAAEIAYARQHGKTVRFLEPEQQP